MKVTTSDKELEEYFSIQNTYVRTPAGKNSISVSKAFGKYGQTVVNEVSKLVQMVWCSKYWGSAFCLFLLQSNYFVKIPFWTIGR